MAQTYLESQFKVMESNFLRLVKLFHVHKDTTDWQLQLLASTMDAHSTALNQLAKDIPDHAPQEVEITDRIPVKSQS
jgi:hypothetical protein